MEYVHLHSDEHGLRVRSAEVAFRGRRRRWSRLACVVGDSGESERSEVIRIEGGHVLDPPFASEGSVAYSGIEVTVKGYWHGGPAAVSAHYADAGDSDASSSDVVSSTSIVTVS